MTETDTKRRIQLALSEPYARLWNNPIGRGWQSNAHRDNNDGTVTLLNPRRINFGLAPGSSDLIGLQSVVITPDMVGQRVAVFCAVEVKSKTGRATEEQTNFIDTVIRLGGRAGIARNENDARLIVK